MAKPAQPRRPDPALAHEARLEAVLESVTDGFYALDTEWRYVVFNRAAEEYFGVSRERLLGRVMWDVFPQGRGTNFERRCRAAMDDRVASRFETPSRLRPDRTVELRIVPMRDGGIAVVLTDITDRKQAEERRRLLVNELNHRVKNALATVQAIAAQSLRGDDVPPAVRERFMDRLLALAHTNDLLVAENWQGASLRVVADQVASPHVTPDDADRFVIDGEDVRLTPAAATAMALALHELATNASKYGALSSPHGRVELSWRFCGADPERRIELLWRERGGPRVATPTRTGFGTRLLERGLKAEFGASVRLDYAAEGLTCTISAPLGEGVLARD